MQISEIPDDGWYKKDYRRLEFDHKYDTPLDDVDVVFHNSGVNRWCVLFSLMQNVTGITYRLLFELLFNLIQEDHVTEERTRTHMSQCISTDFKVSKPKPWELI
jgi:hypothetical protein